MVIAIIGESCVGKSAIAKELSQRLGGTIYTGKDYTRLAKSETEAEAVFIAMLKEACDGETIIYVITENDHLTLLPDDAIKIVILADLDTIKERFAKRTNGNLPAPVAAMLEAKHGMFDNLDCHLRIDNVGEDISAACEKIIEILV